MKNCLIVEDSDVVREVAETIVLELGLTPKEAADPAEAQKAIMDAPPDVILLDWNLPDGGAIEVLRFLKDSGLDPRPKVILCASEYEPKQFVLAKAAGATHYLLKPYDRDTVRKKFEDVGVL